MHDTEYYCRDCGETFDAEPPYYNEPTKCPFFSCQSTDIITESQHQLDVQANAADEQAEEFRIIKNRRW